jgi:glutamine amidotransferase
MITILDFGLGNVSAFTGLFHRLGVPCVIARTESEVAVGSKLILPGVGAFDRAMERLEGSGLAAAVKTAVAERQAPVLGVCVGMQVLFESSEEGSRPGLGLLPGRVVRLGKSAASESLRFPHLGWNSVDWIGDHPIAHGLQAEQFYFLHSFCAQPDRSSDIIGTTDYGGRFASVVRNGPIFGIQCHPEKSHHGGVTLLRNFASLSLP